VKDRVEVRFVVSRQFASHLKKIVRAEKARERGRSYTANLADTYVSEVLAASGTAATPELIESKRQQLLVKRMSLELKRAARSAKGHE
jgi:hypothetical protein